MTSVNKLHITFLHGWGMNQGIWTSFFDYCRSKCPNHIVFTALDLPGSGLSGDIKMPSYTVESIANVVSSQLKPNTLLVGWSMGGLIAQRLADSNDKNVVGHVQIASSPKFLQSPMWEGIKPEVLTMFSQQLQSDHMALLKRFLGIQCLGLAKPKAQSKQMLNAICEFPLSSKDNLQKSLDLLIDTDLRPNTKTPTENQLPCLRIFGGLDSLVPQRAIPEIKKLFPNNDILVIAKASHAPFLSHPLEIWQALETFANLHCGQSKS